MGEGGLDHGMTIHPTPFNQETVFDSAKKYIEQVFDPILASVLMEYKDKSWTLSKN